VYGGGVGLKENRTTEEHFNAERNKLRKKFLWFSERSSFELIESYEVQSSIQSAPLSFYILYLYFLPLILFWF